MRGRVNCIGNKNTCFKSYVRQSYFGEMEVLQKIPRLFSTKAHIECNLLIIDIQNFERILAMFPELNYKLLERAIRRMISTQVSQLRFDHFEGITVNDNFWNEETAKRGWLHTMVEEWLGLIEKKANKSRLSMR